MSSPSPSRSESSTDFDVIVVGAGHVGSVCALALALHGARVALVAGASSADIGSGWADEPWDRRVYAIGAAGKRLLEDLRIWNMLDRARIAPIVDMHVYDRTPATAQLHFGAYESAVEALAWIVEHRQLTRAIDGALEFQRQVTRFSLDAEDIVVSGERVTVTTSRGLLSAALIVGADGSRSHTREQVGIVAHTRPYAQTGVVANFATAGGHRGAAHQWFTQDGVVALLPLPGDAVSLVWSAPEELAAELLAPGGALLLERLHALVDPPFRTLTPLGGASGFPLSMLRADSSIGTRVALVGDAAHVVHPLAGQGLNLGLEDVRVLIEALAGGESPRDWGDFILLRRYQRRRAEAVWMMREMTDGLQRLFASRHPVVSTFRAGGLNIVERLPSLKRALARHAMG